MTARALRGTIDGQPAKLCGTCRTMVALSNFHRSAGACDGLTNACKPCARARAIAHRAANVERYREHDRARARTPERRRQDADALRRKRANRPERARAHVLVGNAIRSGKLVRQPCGRCGALAVDAHHDDYSRPLDVLWLCRTHHNERHAELRANRLRQGVLEFSGKEARSA